MTDVLSGVRVIELASWTFVPAAGVALADWGADVIKIEHPQGGDPGRALVVGGLAPGKGKTALDYMLELGNRGKRSVGLDLRHEVGRELLLKLVENADVFLTNWLSDARRKLRIDVEDLRAVNPKLIYARGSGLGPRGPEATNGGFDAASYLARGSVAYALATDPTERPMAQRPAYGDLPSGLTLAGGIVAALYRRERTGEPSVVDVSLLSQAMWTMAPDIMAADFFDVDRIPTGVGKMALNPITNSYRTRDNRWLQLVMLQPDRYWRPLCEAIGRPDLAEDPRFPDGASLVKNAAEAVEELDRTFAEHDLDHWRRALAKQEGVWAVVQSPQEVLRDPQAVANEYLVEATDAAGVPYRFVANPIQIDESAPRPAQAPEHGQHTEEVLLEAGMTWDDIIAAKERGAVM
ncbi:CoA transferase [Nonomuraea sp. NPDC049649]|uniref:CaiB/BaiF CoA transferase family protein n=1 Tax=Nonomuraea sp. NPDC049649 TaxID=3155776 RepID=UPI003419DA9E